MINLNSEERAVKIRSASFALKNYFKYFQIDENLNEIYKKLSTGNSFVEPENLIEYVKEKGINLTKKSFTKEEFLGFGKGMYPIVALVKRDDLDRYIFIEKRKGNSLVITENDKQKTITLDEFFERSEFACIVSEVQGSYINTKFIKKEFLEIANSKNKLFTTLVVQALGYVLMGVFAMLWAKEINTSTVNESLRIFSVIFTSFLIIGLQISFLSHARQTVKGIALLHDTVKIDTHLFDISKNLGDKNLKYVEDYLQIVRKDATNQKLSVSNLVLTIVFCATISIFMIIAILTINIGLFVGCLAISVLAIFLSLYIGKKSNLRYLKMKLAEKEYFDYLEDISRLSNEKKHIAEDASVHEVKINKFNQYVTSNFELERLDSMFKTTIDLFILGAIAVTVLFIYSKTSTVTVDTASMFIDVTIYIIPFILPFRVLILKLYDKAKIEHEFYFTNYYFEIIEKYAAEVKVENTKTNGKFEKSLILKNLYYERYFNKPVLKSVNIKIPKGKKVLIYGKSGAGKTALANLIAQNLRPTKGEVLLDDKNIDTVNIDKFVENLVFVPDNVQLFNASILENITMFDNVSMKRVVSVCKKLGIHSEIQKKPFNYLTVVEGGNEMLSKVEIKKIAIARAILKNPKFLVLDGLTDVFSEEDIEQINGLIEESNIETVVMFSRHIHPNLKCDIAYNLENGLIQQKTLNNL